MGKERVFKKTRRFDPTSFSVVEVLVEDGTAEVPQEPAPAVPDADAAPKEAPGSEPKKSKESAAKKAARKIAKRSRKAAKSKQKSD